MNQGAISENEITQMREILKEHHKVNKFKFWADFSLNSILSWPLFFYTVFYPNIYTFLISTFFLYKGTMLIHEVSHLAKKIPGYRFAYNLVFGWPGSYPAYIYDTHLFHHGKRTYGTKRDPEYKYISSYNFLVICRPFVASLILPLISWIRFGLIPFFELFFTKKMKIKLLKTFSTLVFSIDYVRPIRNEEKAIREMLFNDLVCVLYKLVFIGLLYLGVLPMRALFYLYCAIVLSSLVNMYRALFNHLYANESQESLSWEDHLVDTVTIRPSLLTSIIFVNGLNFHSLHHLFPDIPYLNLKSAHVTLTEKLSEDHIYNKNVFDSVFSVLKFNMSKDRKNKMTKIIETHPVS